MKKKLIAMLLSAAMCLSLAACGQKADTPDTTDPAEPSGDAATYTVGICQLVQHEALDAATQGFIDALNEALPGQVKFEEKNASGDSNSCATIVNGFVSEGVDLIMANATAALQAARPNTRIRERQRHRARLVRDFMLVSPFCPACKRNGPQRPGSR